MIGQTIIELDRVDSTNTYANQVLAKSEPEEGTVIWAHEQFAGRGQLEHHWISEADKNLTFTVIFKPRFLAPGKQFLLNKAVALGLVDFIRNSIAAIDSAENPGQEPEPGLSGFISGREPVVTIPEITIKWPNDIYIGNKKVSGILIEHRIMGPLLDTSIVGIGLNINQTNFPPSIPNPGSLIQIIRSEMPLKEALLSVCHFLELRYKSLNPDDMRNLDQEYSNGLLGINQWRNFLQRGIPAEGKITGVDNLGRLLVENREGKLLAFNHGEFNFILDE